jgi:hypothetical protein
MSDELPELTVTLADDLQANDDETSENEEDQSESDTDEEETEEPEHEGKKPTRAEKRIAELTREKYEARNRADQAAKEAQELRATLEYMAQVGGEDQGEQGYYQDPAQIQYLIQQQAIQMQQEQVFNNQCNKVYAEGKKEFANFDEAVGNLQMVGMNREFLDVVSTSDVGHKILNYLGNDLEKAEEIANMHPMQMARELTRLEAKFSSKTKQLSKAPAPIKPLSTTGSSGNVSADNTAAWIAQRNKQKLGR